MGSAEGRVVHVPGSATRWLVVAGLAGLLLLAVVTASTPVTIVAQPIPGTAPSVLVQTPPTPTTSTRTVTPGIPGTESLPSLPPVVATGIQLVALALLVWALVAIARYAWRQLLRVRTRTVEGRAPTAVLPAVPEELVDSADRRLALLRGGEPRNAIVACWVDLEESAATAGLPRFDHETSAEYTVRVLRTWDIAPVALGGLAELYREARYSRHSLGEDHRRDAIDRLEVVHADLRRVVDEQRAQREREEAVLQSSPRASGRSS